jgi:ABC-type branched-subunit amino acid transport system substrate-binding protein
MRQVVRGKAIVVFRIILPAIGVFALMLAFASCGQNDVSDAVLPTQAVRILEIPVTVEVTRIVERQVEKQIVVEATPTPIRPCAASGLDQATSLVIGVLAPLSGANATGGATMLAGINSAVEAINLSGGVQGKPLQTVLYDTASQDAIGARRAEQLITQDCVVAVVGVYDSGVAFSVKEVTQRFQTPLLLVETYNDDLANGRPLELFRLAPSMTQLTQMPSQWLSAVGDYNDDGQLLAVMIVEEASSKMAYVEKAAKWFAQAQIATEMFSVDLPASDFSPVIARLVEMEMPPDALFVHLPGDAALKFQRQLLDNGIGPQKQSLIVMPPAALDSAQFWRLMGDAGRYTVAFRLGPWPTTMGPLGAQAEQSVRRLLNRWPENAAFAGHDAIYLLVDTILRSPSLQGADLVAALETADLELASGRYSFPFNSFNPPDENNLFRWHQWSDAPVLYLQYSEVNQNAADMAVVWPPLYQTVSQPVIRP